MRTMLEMCRGMTSNTSVDNDVLYWANVEMNRSGVVVLVVLPKVAVVVKFVIFVSIIGGASSISPTL